MHGAAKLKYAVSVGIRVEELGLKESRIDDLCVDSTVVRTTKTRVREACVRGLHVQFEIGILHFFVFRRILLQESRNSFSAAKSIFSALSIIDRCNK